MGSLIICTALIVGAIMSFASGLWFVGVILLLMLVL